MERRKDYIVHLFQSVDQKYDTPRYRSCYMDPPIIVVPICICIFTLYFFVKYRHRAHFPI
ncbi:hypothetical protein BCR43DRAFT_495741 [Syncephalastrum racemosum]|uniref:Uncharacterized protein n=1 Tax=Syncephalastrum racemosum TaxID=13706 RepID=A0A1X2H6C3_SYNRA|nr:hypothetical protein BCR43DRAFT_495741 [Syncephalastrum racemosum]